MLERGEIDELKAHLAKVNDKKNMVANSLTLYKTGRKLIERCECAIRYREADLQALADAESLAEKALECFKHDYAKDHAEFLRGVGFLLEVDKACKALPCMSLALNGLGLSGVVGAHGFQYLLPTTFALDSFKESSVSKGIESQSPLDHGAGQTRCRRQEPCT